MDKLPVETIYLDQTILILKNELKIEEEIIVENLYRGFGEAQIFLATAGLNKYVIRFLTNRSDKDYFREIECQKIASISGYGPKIYFSDLEKRVIVMEYLATNSEQKRFPDSYLTLANLLKKIHTGPSFPKTITIFDEIYKDIIFLEKIKQSFVDLKQIKEIVDIINRAIQAFPHSSSIHRDLHPGNIIFSKGQCYAIDYEGASIGDPFFDIATVSVIYATEQKDKEYLLSLYFGRKPTLREVAKLFLMEQICLIFFGLGFLQRVPLELFDGACPPLENFENLMQKFRNIEDDYSESISWLQYPLTLIDKVVTNFNSVRFPLAIAEVESKSN